MTRRHLAGVLGVALAAAAVFLCVAVVRARQQAGTIISAVVEVTPKGATVLSATAVRGSLPPFDSNRLLSVPRGPKHLLIEYTVTMPGSATPRYTGAVHVRLAPIVEEPPDPMPPNRPISPSYAKRYVLIPLPDTGGSPVISFSQLTPDDKVPPDKWARTPIGSAPLPPVSR